MKAWIRKKFHFNFFGDSEVLLKLTPEEAQTLYQVLCTVSPVVTPTSNNTELVLEKNSKRWVDRDSLLPAIRIEGIRMSLRKLGFNFGQGLHRGYQEGKNELIFNDKMEEIIQKNLDS